MIKARQILTPIDADLNDYLLTQQHTHGARHGKVLSLSGIVRATLAGCQRANFALGELQGTDHIAAVIADALTAYRPETTV